MALFAANNIARAVINYSYNGVKLAGLVANIRSADDKERQRIHDFAEAIGTRVVMTLERSKLVAAAELQLMTVVDTNPDSDEATRFRELADFTMGLDVKSIDNPTPLDQEAFFNFMRG